MYYNTPYIIYSVCVVMIARCVYFTVDIPPYEDLGSESPRRGVSFIEVSQVGGAWGRLQAIG